MSENINQLIEARTQDINVIWMPLKVLDGLSLPLGTIVIIVKINAISNGMANSIIEIASILF